MIAKISRPLAVLAVVGWVLMLMMSLAPFADVEPPASASEVAFFVLFPLMLAAVALMYRRVDGRIVEPLILTDAIESSPAWLRYALFGTLLYAFGSFGLKLFRVGVPDTTISMAMLGVFYAAAAVALFAASRPIPDPNSFRLRAN